VESQSNSLLPHSLSLNLWTYSSNLDSSYLPSRKRTLFNFKPHSFTSISKQNQQKYRNKNPKYSPNSTNKNIITKNQKSQTKNNEKNDNNNNHLVSVIRKLGHPPILHYVPLHILDRILPYFPQTNPQDPTRILQLPDLALSRHPRRNPRLRRPPLR